MSAPGAKRRGRVILALDDESAEQGATQRGAQAQSDDDASRAPVPISFSRRPLKSSSLRKSINLGEEVETGGGSKLVSDPDAVDEDDTGLPVVVRPAISRAGSTKKKKGPSSRLSFGPGVATEEGEEQTSTPKRTLGQRTLESNAIKKSGSLQNLPARFLGSEDDRPRYDKAYLDELQSSTPNTPSNISSLKISDDVDDDAMDIDPSELEGATVVTNDTTVARPPSSARPTATILTEAEIREKKDRRARLARESNFISLDASDDENGDGEEPASVRLGTKKPESRLIAEDEDLGEGYDEFVDDGGLSLGRKAERESRRRHRREMEELIRTAEVGSDAESDSSEAERRAAYEAAQRRAGMDGLQRGEDDGTEGGANIVPKMKPLPVLEECLARMRSLVQELEDEVTRKRTRIAELDKEKEEILAREKEVQEILDQAGAKYQAVAGGDVQSTANIVTGQSPLRAVPPGLTGDIPVERGLESFGTTPTTRPDTEDMA